MSVRNPNLRFKEAMRWEGPIEDHITELIRVEAVRLCLQADRLRILNAPCGKSLLGTDRLDIDPLNEPTKVGDINDLPYANESFDVVIQDPVWKLSFYKRMKPFFEAVRVTKLSGLVIYNATWIPSSKATISNFAPMVRSSADFANVSILSIFRKVTCEYDNSAYRAKAQQEETPV
jgi:hypothetical protein